MHGEKPDVRFSHAGRRALHRLPYVVELQIEKNLLAVRDQLSNKVHPLGGVQLHAGFVEIHCAVQLPDQVAGLRCIWEVKSDDDRIVLYIRWIGLPRFSTALPMR